MCNATGSFVGQVHLALEAILKEIADDCFYVEHFVQDQTKRMLAFTTIDFRGFDPSTLTDLFYTFSGCSHMTTIYADSTWALPTSGITGSQCFYSCRALVGGNGTAWSSSNVGYTYMRIDRAGQTGYLTAA